MQGGSDQFVPNDNHRHSLRAFASLGLSMMLVGLFTYVGVTVRNAREAARQTNCRGHMGQLFFALINYHDVYGAFPPAYIADADGKPMHSWRVLILPYLDGVDVYRKYKFDEPWDGPNNSKLAKSDRNRYFHCPSAGHDDDSTLTDYVAIVGRDTVFPGATSTKLSDIEDGPDNTILLVEIHGSKINWMEPRDLLADEMSYRINDPKMPSISSPHRLGPGVVFCERLTTYRLDPSLRPETLKALTTIAGHEPVIKDRLILEGKPSPHYLGE